MGVNCSSVMDSGEEDVVDAVEDSATTAVEKAWRWLPFEEEIPTVPSISLEGAPRESSRVDRV